MEKEYHYIDPRQLVRAPEHNDMFRYKTIEDFEDLQESYTKYDRCHPVYYEQREVDGTVVNAIIDGGKYHEFALANNIEKVFACKLSFDTKDDRITLIAQLQRTCNDNYMALFNMIQALWPKHFKGQGYRSDITEKELEEGTLSQDGKRLNIYDRIGKDLFLSGNKVKQIRKIGMVNNLHFERIEKSRFTLFQAYQECVKEERQELPPIPSIKTPTYHTSTTPLPKFTEPNVTSGNVTAEYVSSEEADETASASTSATGEHQHIAQGEVVTVTDEFTIVRGYCQHCKKQTFLKTNKL